MAAIERWIPTYEGMYSASELGVIVSYKFGRRKVLKPLTGGINPYCHVRLFKDGRGRTLAVHTLVALAFIGPCPVGYDVDHYPDNNVKNCKSNNLRYQRKSRNRASFGRTAHIYRKDSEVAEIKAMAASGATQVNIQRRFGIARITLQDILSGRSRAKVAPSVLTERKPPATETAITNAREQTA